jgi:hypothetical protein
MDYKSKIRKIVKEELLKFLEQEEETLQEDELGKMIAAAEKRQKIEVPKLEGEIAKVKKEMETADPKAKKKLKDKLSALKQRLAVAKLAPSN